MNSNREILKYCPNFYKIINFRPFEDDQMTGKLIKLYQKYIFNINLNDSDDIKSITELDKVINTYIDDYQFRREMQNQIVKIKIKKDTKNLLKDFIKAIIGIFYNYEEYTTRVIYLSKWI